MIRFPNCKINLGLNVVARRPDGFHNIETIFYPVPLHDALEILPAHDGVFRFHATGLKIPGKVENNLCTKAFHLLQAECGIPAVHMHLHKAIPMGSGLGGGSSDAAGTLEMLNDLFSLGLEGEKLVHYASLLGSDCAFFTRGSAQFATGKGDLMEDVGVDLSGLYLAVVVPDIHVATADAYNMVVPHMPDHSVKEVVKLPLEAWKDMLANDFEKPVFTRFPAIGEVKRMLYDAGAVYASLSGSGSAVFGIFREMPELTISEGHFLWTMVL